jgi:hypothetical protein
VDQSTDSHRFVDRKIEQPNSSRGGPTNGRAGSVEKKRKPLHSSKCNVKCIVPNSSAGDHQVLLVPAFVVGIAASGKQYGNCGNSAISKFDSRSIDTSLRKRKPIY